MLYTGGWQAKRTAANYSSGPNGTIVGKFFTATMQRPHGERWNRPATFEIGENTESRTKVADKTRGCHLERVIGGGQEGSATRRLLF